MELSLKNILFLIFAMLSGCNSSVSLYSGDPLEPLLSNKWTFDNEDYSCDIAVQTIKMIGNQLLEFTWHDVKNNKIDNSHQSKIKEINGGYIILEPKIGKDDNSSEKTHWILVMKTDDRFCWRKSDWSILNCSVPMKVCE